MTSPPPPASDDARLRAARRWIAIVLVGLAAAAVALTVARVWPATLAEELATRWFGAASLRLRLVGTFAVLGVGVLAVLLVALAIQRAFTRAGRGGAG